MAAFRGTALDGMTVEPVPDCDVLVVQWPEPGDVLTGWRAARDVTGGSLQMPQIALAWDLTHTNT